MRELCCEKPVATLDNEERQDHESAAGPQRRILVPPAMALLARHEAEQLAGSSALQAAFASWGIGFSGLDASVRRDEHVGLFVRKVDATEDDSGYAQVSVSSVPEIVADKVCSIDVISVLDLTRTVATRGWKPTGPSQVIHIRMGVARRSYAHTFASCVIPERQVLVVSRDPSVSEESARTHQFQGVSRRDHVQRHSDVTAVPDSGQGAV